MNKVNPLYIALLVLFFLGFSIFKLSQAKDTLQKEGEEFVKVEDMALRLDGVKKQYSQEKKLKAQLEKLVSALQAKGVVLQKEEKRNSIKFVSNEIGLYDLNSFVGKILNDSYQIKEFEIKKISDEKARFMMEIQWVK